MKNYILIVTCLFTALSCNVSVTTESSADGEVYEASVLTEMGGFAVVTPDSCSHWGIQRSAFAIEYPEEYQVEFYADNKYYVRLRKYKNDILESEVTIGTFYNISDDSEALDMLNRLDSISSSQEGLLWENIFIGMANATDERSYPTLKSKTNFDSFNIGWMKGDYYLYTMLLKSNHEGIQGVSVSFTISSRLQANPSELTKQQAQIFNSFRFLRPK